MRPLNTYVTSLWCVHSSRYGPLTRYVKLRVAHAPGMPGTFSPPPRISDPDMHHGTCVKHVPWCIPGSLTRGFLWSRGREKRTRHSRRVRNPQFYVSSKRPMLSFWRLPPWQWDHPDKQCTMTSSNGNIFRVTGPLCGESFPSQRPVTRSFDAFFDLRLNKRLSKQTKGRWFETPSRSSRRYFNGHGNH